MTQTDYNILIIGGGSAEYYRARAGKRAMVLEKEIVPSILFLQIPRASQAATEVAAMK